MLTLYSTSSSYPIGAAGVEKVGRGFYALALRHLAKRLLGKKQSPAAPVQHHVNLSEHNPVDLSERQRPLRTTAKCGALQTSEHEMSPLMRLASTQRERRPACPRSGNRAKRFESLCYGEYLLEVCGEYITRERWGRDKGSSFIAEDQNSQRVWRGLGPDMNIQVNREAGSAGDSYLVNGASIVVHGANLSDVSVCAKAVWRRHCMRCLHDCDCARRRRP